MIALSLFLLVSFFGVADGKHDVFIDFGSPVYATKSADNYHMWVVDIYPETDLLNMDVTVVSTDGIGAYFGSNVISLSYKDKIGWDKYSYEFTISFQANGRSYSQDYLFKYTMSTNQGSISEISGLSSDDDDDYEADPMMTIICCGFVFGIVLIIGIATVVIVYLLKKPKPQSQPATSQPPSPELYDLQLRYSRGEITPEEYERQLKN